MRNNIIKWVIFVVAIIDCCLAVAFSFFSFDDSKKESYMQVQEVKAQSPEMVAAFESATVESLPSEIDKYREATNQRNTDLKVKQLEKDILYTYLQELKNLDENHFDEYKANFAEHSASLFAKSENKQKYVEGFGKVNSFKDLEKYVEEVNSEYNTIKQDYLVERNYIKSANSIIAKADAINSTASETKKTADLETFKTDMKSFERSASLQNIFIILAYVLGLGAAFLMLFFLFANMVTNFKSSYKILLGVLALIVAAVIGYAVGSAVLSPSAIKAGMSGSGYKMVNAAVFTFYVCFFGAILSVIVTLIISAIKNRN